MVIKSTKLTHYFFPPVYRYMNEEWIAEFFKKGKLRLSSFKKFREYPDEIRGDTTEGRASYKTQLENQSNLVYRTSFGDDQYMFCTSLTESQTIKKKFEVNSYFKIKDPFNFSREILKSISGASEGFLGFCSYSDSRTIETNVSASIMDIINEGININTLGKYGSSNNGLEAMFLKENKHSDQNEFRFIWTMSSSHNLPDYIDIYCESAIKFCERIK